MKTNGNSLIPTYCKCLPHTQLPQTDTLDYFWVFAPFTTPHSDNALSGSQAHPIPALHFIPCSHCCSRTLLQQYGHSKSCFLQIIYTATRVFCLNCNLIRSKSSDKLLLTKHWFHGGSSLVMHLYSPFFSLKRSYCSSPSTKHLLIFLSLYWSTLQPIPLCRPLKHYKKIALSSVVVWKVDPPPAVSASLMAQALTALILVQLPANVQGKAAEDGPRGWPPPTHMGKCSWSSGLLALTWIRPCHCSHLENLPADGRYLLEADKQLP